MSNTYSFADVAATLVGPTGIVDLGYGAAVAEEGITIEPAGDKNTMLIGADGEGMHSLHADKSGTITVRLLKTSPTNLKLQAMYNAQTLNGALHGQADDNGGDADRSDQAADIGAPHPGQQ